MQQREPSGSSSSFSQAVMVMDFVHSLTIDTRKRSSPLAAPTEDTPGHLPDATHQHTHAAFPLTHSASQDDSKLSIYFVGTVSFAC